MLYKIIDSLYKNLWIKGKNYVSRIGSNFLKAGIGYGESCFPKDTKASDRLITFNNLKVAVLGLTFKPGTDDLREAPSLDNVKLLLEKGANIYAYDPVGEENYKKKYPTEITYVKTPQEALKDANVCFIFTEWNEIKNVKPEEYKKLMKIPLVYDGRNIYDLKDMVKEGVEYYSIGR